MADPRMEPVSWEVERPRRMSVTLGRKADECARDAGLYLRYKGKASTGPLIRGSLGHLALERIMGSLMAHGESSLFAPQPGEDPVKAAAEVSQTTKDWVDELAVETGWPISEAELDQCRIVAYHFAIANDVDPGQVVALEQTFVLPLDDGGELIGKVDLAWMTPEGILEVRDYKTSLYVPEEAAVQSLVQVPWYAALILWGRPLHRRDCDCAGQVTLVCRACGGRDLYPAQYVEKHMVDGQAWASCTTCGAPDRDGTPQDVVPCARCEGRGYVEELGEPLGLDFVQWVRCMQVYPMFINEASGLMSSRGGDRLWSLPDLRDKANAASRIWARVLRGVNERVWPAKSGSHCAECTARVECPLPAQLRSHAGEIDSAEQASEAMEWAVRQGALVTATKKEVASFMKTARAPEDARLPVGSDTFGFVVSHPRSLRKKGQAADWEGLEDAALAAADEGEPFAIDDWLVARPKTEFKKIKKEED